MMYQATILAAGRGTRLAEITGGIPKAILPIGPRSLVDPSETSFLRRQIELLVELGVDDLVVVVGYSGDMIVAELEDWAPWVHVVENPRSDVTGSLYSFQCAARSPFGVLDGTRQTLMIDADIVYHRNVLKLLLQAPEKTSLVVCQTKTADNEEVLVYGTPEHPRFIGKGLAETLVDGAPCIGEATGIVKFAREDHALAREAIDWMVGDPDVPQDDPRCLGFAPARCRTEHEELSQLFMHHGRMRCSVFGVELPFMEADSADEYARVREDFYPRLLRMEDEGNGV